MNPLSPLTHDRRHKRRAVMLAALHYGEYAPLGLRLDLSGLTPWLYTLPVPGALLAASTGTTAWMLSRFDPVATIERRS